MPQHILWHHALKVCCYSVYNVILPVSTLLVQAKPEAKAQDPPVEAAKAEE